jgi:predicted PurR-regulated permease PerM
MVILPLVMIVVSLGQEGSNLYVKVQSGEYDFARYIQRVFDLLPSWAIDFLDRFNLTNLTTVRETLASGLMKGGQVLAPQAVSIGMNTFDSMIGLGIMLYLLFFYCVTGKP